jgi:hypothetical protein
MRYARLLVIPILAALTLLLGANPSSAAAPTYQNTVTIHLPSTLNQLTSFDISFVDASRSTYVLADRNNASIDVFDTQDDRFVRASDSVFTGLGTGPGCKTGSGPNTNAANSGGPNGVVIISNRGEDEDRWPTDLTSFADIGHIGVSDDEENRDRGQAWAGDGNSTVKVIDLNTGHQVGSSIPTGGTCRADELWNDPKHKEIMIGNPNDSVVLQTFISTVGTPGPNSVLGQLKFDGLTGCAVGTIPGVGSRRICHTVAATAGIEQPIFALDHFWVAIGATTENPGGEIAEIDPTTFERIAAIPVTCGPSGLTFIPPNRAAAACGTAGVQFFDLQSKTLLGTNVAETGGADQVWYANGNVYAPDSNVAMPELPGGCARTVAIETTPNPPGFLGGQTNSCLAVIDASSRTVIAEVQLPAFGGSHSVAADSRNHKVFVPVRDSTCSTHGGSNPCPVPLAPAVPGPIPPCPPEEEGGCVHDQGIAVVQLVR